MILDTTYNNKKLKELLIEITINACQILIDEKTNLKTSIKKDKSPVTSADLKANSYINKELKKTNIPIISEENKHVSFSKRSKFKKYWLIDPLDGTKEYINGNEYYTTNICLVIDNKPIVGVIGAPEKKYLYYGNSDINQFEVYTYNKSSIKKIKIFSLKKNNSILVSNSHVTEEKKISKKFFLDINNFLSMGSSIKFCYVATGEYVGYLRSGPTMEWDIAAGVAICKAAGLLTKEITSNKVLKFNKKDLINKGFYVKGNS